MESCSQGTTGLDSLFIAYAIIPVSHDPIKRRKNLHKHGIDPVSYTHLDVYKRQVPFRVSGISPVPA